MGAPVVFKDLVIVTTDGGQLTALDRFTRATVWRYPSPYTTATVTSAQLFDDVLYQDGGNDRVYAIRASTGKVLWNTLTWGTVDADLVITANRVYATNFDRLNILNRNTGRYVARIRSPQEHFRGLGASGTQIFAVVRYGGMSFREP
jgi:outer membrane protein assembly factor BamB